MADSFQHAEVETLLNRLGLISDTAGLVTTVRPDSHFGIRRVVIRRTDTEFHLSSEYQRGRTLKGGNAMKVAVAVCEMLMGQD